MHNWDSFIVISMYVALVHTGMKTNTMISPQNIPTDDTLNINYMHALMNTHTHMRWKIFDKCNSLYVLLIINDKGKLLISQWFEGITHTHTQINIYTHSYLHKYKYPHAYIGLK